MHLGGVLLAQMARIDLVHIPYKGAQPTMIDLIGGQIPLAIVDVASTRSFIKSGKIKALATLGPTRSRLAPDIPTMVESGFPGLVAQSWSGIVAPARTPPEIVARLGSHLVAILDDADTRERFLTVGMEASPSSPEEFTAFIKSEISRWAAVIKEGKIKLD
jgi:tripartite-type tricarboxylate transporter receptor subunit TctC